MSNSNLLDRLIGAFQLLPGVGYKTAQRYAYSILSSSEEDVLNLCACLEQAKLNIKFCKTCGNFAEQENCEICKSRQSDIICVVAEPKDIVSLEKVRNLKCLYHVLHGTINPLKGISYEDLKIKELLVRVHTGNFSEIIVATNPSPEGEATALYISRIIKPLGIKVTRLAQGISMGSDLEYADEVTLTKAIESRREI